MGIRYISSAMDQKEPVGVVHPRRWRYLIDIIVLVAASFALPIGFGAVYTPKTMQSEFVFAAFVQLLGVAIAWMLVRLRGERLADIGLKRPENWWRTIMIGLVAAALVFAAMYISEKAGFRRDLSRFKDAKGNLELTMYGVFYALIGAGFYEEFMFRGFLMQGMAMFFGGSRGAWIVAMCPARRAFRGSARLPESSRYRDHRHIGRLPGIAGSCVRAQPLAGNHWAWTFRREPFCLILFSRTAAWVSCSVSRSWRFVNDLIGASRTRNRSAARCGCV